MIKVKSILIANIPILFISLVVILLTYVNGLNGEFISDDIPGILENATIQNLSEALKMNDIQIAIQSLIYTTFGANPVPFHTFSLFLHIVNVILFFLIAYILFDKKTAAMATPLFALHPVGSEAVLWMSAINYLLHAFFIFTCLLLYLIYKKNKSKKHLYILYVYYTLILLFFTNPWIYILPFLLAGIDFFYFEKKISKKSVLVLLILFLIAAFDFLHLAKIGNKNTLGNTVGRRIESLRTEEAAPYLNRLPYSIYMATELLTIPANLSLYHEGELITKQKLALMTIYSLILIGWMIVNIRKKEKYKVNGLIYLIYISVLIVFSPVQVSWFIADRYLYIGSGFFAILVALILLNLDKKFPNTNFALFTTVILVLIYSAVSFSRTVDWKTRKSLWLATEEVAPFSHRVHNNLGDVYARERNFERSAAHFQQAIRINPNYAEAMHNLGNIYLQVGQLDAAKQQYQKSLSINPTIFQSYYKLGIVAYNQEDPELAKQLFIKSLELNPNYAPAAQALNQLNNQ